jgi:hypothetical protein
MPYSYSTLGQLKTQLATRLFDTGNVFWTDTELTILLTESLRTFGLLSGFWRERAAFPASTGTPFYDLSVQCPGLLDYTVTDQSIIQAIQYHLLESASSQTSWTGTEMFTYADIVNAVQNRLNQFLADTGCVTTVSIINMLSPPIGRELLVDTVIDVRRVAWRNVTNVVTEIISGGGAGVGLSLPFSLNMGGGGASSSRTTSSVYYTPLWRSDERELTAGDQTWSVTPGSPEAYSIMGPPPLQVQIAPVPQLGGQLELLIVSAGPTLNPSTVATPVGIPDDLTPAIKWGALADLLGKDGIARDPIRATYCEQRYQLYVQLARLLPVVVHAEIQGQPLIPTTLQEVESSTPLWENTRGVPQDLILAASNLIALNPVPNGITSVTLDVVRKSVIPTGNASFVQVGREQLDMILDYAEHLALFKVAGAEWHATDRQAQNFMLQALTYNQRISAAVRNAASAAAQSQRQKSQIPRRLETPVGIGAFHGR